jgi:hypothetical protein
MPSLSRPIRANHTFVGYFDKPSGGTRYYNADMTSARRWDIDKDVVLYAQWASIDVEVQLDMQGGTGGSTSVLATVGKPMPKADAPMLDGHDFVGYFDDADIQYYDADMTSTRNWDKFVRTTLHARYTPQDNTGGGTGGGGNGGSGGGNGGDTDGGGTDGGGNGGDQDKDKTPDTGINLPLLLGGVAGGIALVGAAGGIGILVIARRNKRY